MSQNDFVIDNATAAAVRADLNAALQALAGLSSGPTAPTTTYANMLWYDTANSVLKMRSAANDAWISLFDLDQSGNTAAPSESTAALTVQETLSDVTITAGSFAAFTHSLGSIPSLIQTYLVCQTAEHGYPVGRVISLNNHLSAGAASGYGHSLSLTSADIGIQFGSNAGVYQILEVPTGNLVTITPSRWRLRVRLWR